METTINKHFKKNKAYSLKEEQRDKLWGIGTAIPLVGLLITGPTFVVTYVAVVTVLAGLSAASYGGAINYRLRDRFSKATTDMSKREKTIEVLKSLSPIALK